MEFEVFRGLRDLVIAPVTILPTGEEVFGAVEPLSGIQSMEKAVEEANETLYLDDTAAIVIAAEGSDEYTMTVSVPALATRAKIEGRKWDSKKMAYLSTAKEERYYALGFKAGVLGDVKREEYYWIYKGKFTLASESHPTADNSTTHNLMQYTYTSIFTEKDFDGQPLKYLAIDNTHKLAKTFFDKVTLPSDLTPKV